MSRSVEDSTSREIYNITPARSLNTKNSASTTMERTRRGSVLIQESAPGAPALAVTRNSSSDIENPFQPRRTSTFDSSNNFPLRPPATPQGTESHVYPYTTRTGTNEVSLYQTVTDYSQWDDQQQHDETKDAAPVPNRLNDHVPRAKPPVDYQDMLWTQIDILDDVRRMAQQTSTDGSFFSAEHARAVAELRGSQTALLNDLKSCEKVLDSTDDHKVIWDSKDIESVRERLYNREYFDKVRTGLENVKRSLGEVTESMKKIEDRDVDSDLPTPDL